MRSQDVAAGEVGRIGQFNKLKDDAYLSSMLLAHEQDTPGLTLEVEEGIAYFGSTRVDYAGGSSPTFTAPVTHPRIDALVLKRDGTLLRIAGTENSSPVPPQIPTSYVAIALIYNRVGQTTIRDASVSGQGYIYKDLRSPLRLPTDGLNNVTYTYNSDDSVDTITDEDSGTVYTFAYNSNGDVESITDGTSTWTLTYTNGLVTSVVLT